MTNNPLHLAFTKMQATGNDFIVVDNRQQNLSKEDIVSLTPELCDRHYGIGADGVIALEDPVNESLDYTMFYRNADGSDAGMCGNGARCLALFAAEQGLGKNLQFNVHQKIYRAKVKPKNQVEISFPLDVSTNEMKIDEMPLLKLYTGTEHIVLQADGSELRNEDALLEKAHYLRHHEKFKPQGTNINFMHPLSDNTIELQTFEKGVEDLTLACGTGAIASALAWHHIKKGDKSSQTTVVKTDGGLLQVKYSYHQKEDHYSDIILSGEARIVFKGIYEI